MLTYITALKRAVWPCPVHGVCVPGRRRATPRLSGGPAAPVWPGGQLAGPRPSPHTSCWAAAQCPVPPPSPPLSPPEHFHAATLSALESGSRRVPRWRRCPRACARPQGPRGSGCQPASPPLAHSAPRVLGSAEPPRPGSRLPGAYSPRGLLQLEFRAEGGLQTERLGRWF